MEIEFERRTRKPRQVALISLIDVMFVLLLFFMIAGHLEKVSPVMVDLPVADSGQVLDEGPIEIVLGYEGEIVINDNRILTIGVEQEIKRQLAHNPQRIITIKADANMEANRLVALLEQIRAAGGINLSIVTQSLNGLN
jgi:biopolymer transport protein ExbD